MTVTDCADVPPGPVHASPNVEVTVRAPVETFDPEVALAPDQVPDAVQVDALLDDHVSLDDEPEATVGGEALIVMIGRGAAETGPTETVAD